MSVLKNLKIGAQIALIAGIAIMGFVIVGVMYITSTNTQAGFAETQKSESAGVLYVAEVTKGFLTERRNEKDFFLRMDLKYAERHKAEVANVLPYFEKLKEIHQEPDEQQLVGEMEEIFLAYAAQFNEVVEDWKVIGLTQKEGLYKILNDLGEEVVGDLKPHPELLVVFLEMREHEKSFMLTLSENDRTSLAAFADEFRAALVDEDLSEAEKAEVADDIVQYQKAFEQVASLRAEIAGDQKVLSATFASIIPGLEFFDEKGSADALAATEALEENKASTFSLMATTIGVVTVIVLMLGYVIGRGISKPLAEVAGNMDELAKGNLDEEILNTDYTNEVGTMTKAVEVFKENAIENRRLAAEAEKECVERAERVEQRRIEEVEAEKKAAEAEELQKREMEQERKRVMHEM
ncbi:MAG: HAMP domain-containing protein [Rhodospirillales bacterium]|nr:HAMP domain-containing protein [Rhodospirillales bacterium]